MARGFHTVAPDEAGFGGPFNVTQAPGRVDTLYANAGIVNLRTNRTDEAAAMPAAPALRKLTHFRAPGLGDAMWSGQCVYDFAGVSPAYSEYDATSLYQKDTGLNEQVRKGVRKSFLRLPANEPTTTRVPRVSAFRDSGPAAAFFQGTFNPRWSGLFAGYFHPRVQPRPLHANFNPGQMGTKELHKATQYQPVPPMGAIVGYFGMEGKAL